jgi:hypothetical protein
MFALEGAMAQLGQPVDKSAENLMVVLRESAGANTQSESLHPLGKGRVKLSDGREVEVEFAAFQFLGDMHVRFVFDGPTTLINATPQDLARLNLDPEHAIRLAVANIKRTYGNPVATSWTGGLMQVKGKSPDLDSSYFLDRDFWRALLEQHPDGLVVAVPKRGGLLFTPLTASRSVEGLRNGVTQLHWSSDSLRVSSALYLFKDDRWTVFQPPRPGGGGVGPRTVR